MSTCYHRRTPRVQTRAAERLLDPVCASRVIDTSNQKLVDGRVALRQDVPPMARMFTAESLLREPTPSSFGAHTCQPGSRLGHEQTPDRRDAVTVGNPDERW
jgi:hypothetical protein